jgi:hypothetical protein
MKLSATLITLVHVKGRKYLTIIIPNSAIFIVNLVDMGEK